MESSNFYESQQQQLGKSKVSDHHSNPTTLPLWNKDEYEHYMNEIQLITNNDIYFGGDDDEYESCPTFYNNSLQLQNAVYLNQNVCGNDHLFFPEGKAAASSSSTNYININYNVLDSTVITSSSSNSDLPTHFFTNNCTPSSSSHNQIYHHHHSGYSESTSSNKTSACKDKAISRTKRVCSSSQKDAALKKQRAPTQSSCPLPKVVKEKIGDRIAALHRLVAPFGKTDSASVLTEAIGYIHFLHHQIQTLSMSCIKPSQSNRLRCFQQVSGKQKGKECWDAKQADLKSRGLCAVPISVAAYVSSFSVGL